MAESDDLPQAIDETVVEGERGRIFMDIFRSLGLLLGWIIIQRFAEGLESPRQHRSFFDMYAP